MFNGVFRGKKVLVTGNTGFKGSWLTAWLLMCGAEVYGYSIDVPTEPAMFDVLGLRERIHHRFGDIRDRKMFRDYLREVKPDFIFHLAAQAIVSASYAEPFDTVTTNVVGTASVLDAVRSADWNLTVVMITSDKAYDNVEWIWGYRENEELNGFDPYSNSKSCSELVTSCYRDSFLKEAGVAVSTARAGNVIGGGDFAADRIIPDCVRAVEAGREILVRNPRSIRPYQHVLEPLTVYLMIAQRQMEDPSLANWYNIGPDEEDCVTTGTLVDLFCKAWGEQATWTNLSEQNAPHEAGYLKLDCSLLKSTFHWKPTWHIAEAVEETCRWSKAWLQQGDLRAEMRQEIDAFFTQMKNNQ